MTDPGHCRYCGRFVPEAAPDAEHVTCPYCVMKRAASPEVEQECLRREVEWLRAQKNGRATRRAKRVSRELARMEVEA